MDFYQTKPKKKLERTKCFLHMAKNPIDGME
jgi:hypothetical protein